MSNPNVFDYTKDSTFQSESNFRADKCNESRHNYDNHSIFGYMTDSNMYINKNSCLDDTPVFTPYIQSGIPLESIDIENELRGTTRPNTRCSSKKWQSPDPELAEKVSTIPLFNKVLCQANNKILPNGYISKIPVLKWDGKQFILINK